MQIPANPFLQALEGDDIQYDLWAGFATGYAAENCATTGFDWMLIDGEHAPNTVPTILAQLQAAGKPPGILVPVGADAHRYASLGCRFIAVGIDISLLRQGALATITRYKDTTPDDSAASSTY